MGLLRVASAMSVCAMAFSVQAEQLPIEVLSAVVKDQKIADAEVLLQRNGAQNVVGRTNAQGQVTLTSEAADDASNLLIIKKPGYSNLVVKCPCKGMTYAISPVMENLDGLRVVLTWGKAPRDLDSHMIFPGNNIFFRNKKGTDAELDVDDTDSYGPETITLQKKHYGESYVYAVHDYSNSGYPNSSELSNSEAKVFVYMGQSLVRTYYVPQNRTGNLWTVFRMTGSGDFQDINTFTGVRVGAEDVLNEVKPLLDDSVAVTAVTVSSAVQADAKKLNLQGEAAYQALTWTRLSTTSAKPLSWITASVRLTAILVWRIRKRVTPRNRSGPTARLLLWLRVPMPQRYAPVPTTTLRGSTKRLGSSRMHCVTISWPSSRRPTRCMTRRLSVCRIADSAVAQI